MRPDEKVVMAKEEQSNRFTNTAKSLASGVASGAGFSAGANLVSKLAPFFSEYIPTDLAIKGINKISPGIGKFLQKGVQQGLDPKEGLNYIQENLQKHNLQENSNIIRQYSDQLDELIKGELDQGKPLANALAKALSNKEHHEVIKKIEKDHKSDIMNIAKAVYGTQEQTQQVPQNQIPVQKQQKTLPSPEMGNQDQQLIAALQKILQM